MMVSSSIDQDNGNYVSFKFGKDETITVEFDPATGKLRYSKQDKSCFEQQTSISKSTTQPVHFCVATWDGSVKIVPQ